MVRGKLIGQPKKQTRPLFVPLQFEMARRLGAWYCVWNVARRKGYLFRADEEFIRGKWQETPEYSFDEIVKRMALLFGNYIVNSHK